MLRRKWIPVIFLALFFASCATLTYNKPPWGTSKEAYLITTIASTGDPASAHMEIYEVPLKTKSNSNTETIHTRDNLGSI